MERRSITITNDDIVRVVSSYSWLSGQAIYIVSGTGYISDALLLPFTSQEQSRYQGYRRIERIIGHFEPTNPNGRNENGRIHITLASVHRAVATARASRLFTPNAVLQIIVERRMPPSYTTCGNR